MLKKVSILIALLGFNISAFADATLVLQDNTGYGLKITAPSLFPKATAIGSSVSVNLPDASCGSAPAPLSDTAQITDPTPATSCTPANPCAPQGSIAWTCTNNGTGSEEFDLFAGGKPWDVYTKQYCINLTSTDGTVYTKCTNPNSDWDPLKIIVPKFEKSTVTITFTVPKSA